MARSRLDKLIKLAEEQDGLLTAASARAAGISDSVLVRLMQRGRLERVARGTNLSFRRSEISSPFSIPSF